VGAVVNKLKAEQIWENTLLIFLTDNGGAGAMEANNGSLRGFKQMLYEGGIRTPWIVSWPAKFPGGRSIDTPVISFDILPTVLDALEIEVDRAFDGKSLLPLIEGAAQTHHAALHWDIAGPRKEWAARQGDWKLFSSRGKQELYHLEKDPSETTDVIDLNPAKVKELLELHKKWKKDVEASSASASK